MRLPVRFTTWRIRLGERLLKYELQYEREEHDELVAEERGMHVDLVAELIEQAIQTTRGLENERDAILSEARIWAQEAKTQEATVREMYQILSGATGECGTSHGAEPLRRVADAGRPRRRRRLP